MATSAVMSQLEPQTLTDRQHEIITLTVQKTVAELAPRDVKQRRPGIIELVVKFGNVMRRIEFSVPDMPVPRWLVPTIERSGRLLSLPSNWDLQGASPIDPKSIQVGVEALYDFMSEGGSLPQWTPTRDGGVQLDWHENGIDLEIQFGTTTEPYAVFEDSERPATEWDGPLNASNLDKLRRVFEERLRLP